jgi:signal transduction histidine kinase
LAALSVIDDEHPSPVELSSVIEAAIRWSSVTLQSGARLQTTLASSALVRAEPTRLSQMFVHLLNHAADAVSAKLPASERVIEVTVRDEDATHVVAEIANNGPGVAQDQAAQLFDFVFKDSRVQRRDGRGLAVARLIAERANGTIDVESRPQGPTVFRVHLPCTVSGYTPTDATPTL